MSEPKSSTIGHALVAMYGQLTTKFRADHSGGERRGIFTPDEPFDPCEPNLAVWSRCFTERYGVDRRATVGEELNGKNFYPDVIEFLLRHPDNPLGMTPEAIRSLTTPPINGTREWMVVRQDCCCVMVGGKVAMEALELLAKVLGYGAAPAPAESAATTSAQVSELPPLAPVEQRASELGEIATEVWRGQRWLLGEELMGRIVTAIATVGLPIWRRAQERIAQRTAEILREGGK